MLRLTGGEFRGRLIDAPPGDRTRPTQARLRQALFNSLQAQVPGARVLDLFAGSGALGFEALSRGAEHVTFVESERTVLRFLSKNATALKVEDRVTIIGNPLESAVPKLQGPFDLVLADPPYAGGWELKLLSDLRWNELLAEGGILCIEWGTVKSQAEELPESVPFLEKVREKIYGESVLTTYKRS